jgi:sterol desaturase/sphingolipid hydroxylase (fatty acid hydroxylase superfamily)
LQPDLLRLIVFVVIFLVLALVELAAPRRRPTTSKSGRWLTNLGLATLNSVAVRLLVPIGAVGVATLAEENGIGLFNRIELPAWAAGVGAFLLLDFALYLQHVLFHALPFLWRLHRFHHADKDFDVTTGLRFHTLEILLSFGIKLAVIAILGAPPLSVVVFEIVLNAASMFNHANCKLPSWLDRVLRLFIVTPDMHRVHHSTNPLELNSNFGFNLPWWDYLLGSYRAAPLGGHEEMAIGLPEKPHD